LPSDETEENVNDSKLLCPTWALGQRAGQQIVRVVIGHKSAQSTAH